MNQYLQNPRKHTMEEMTKMKNHSVITMRFKKSILTQVIMSLLLIHVITLTAIAESQENFSAEKLLEGMLKSSKNIVSGVVKGSFSEVIDPDPLTFPKMDAASNDRIQKLTVAKNKLDKTNLETFTKMQAIYNQNIIEEGKSLQYFKQERRRYADFEQSFLISNKKKMSFQSQKNTRKDLLSKEIMEHDTLTQLAALNNDRKVILYPDVGEGTANIYKKDSNQENPHPVETFGYLNLLAGGNYSPDAPDSSSISNTEILGTEKTELGLEYKLKLNMSPVEGFNCKIIASICPEKGFVISQVDSYFNDSEKPVFTVRNSNFKQVSGIWYPFKVEEKSKNSNSDKFCFYKTFEIKEADFNIEIDEQLFNLDIPTSYYVYDNTVSTPVGCCKVKSCKTKQ
jgi:hypothetical protein